MAVAVAPAAPEPVPARGRVPNLDLVRFAAATLVLVSHSFTLGGRGGEPALFGYETLGGLAVAVFFLISGYLVTGAWHRNPSLAVFAQHRALRILPALVVVVTLSALVLGPLLTPLALGAYFEHPQTLGYFANLTFIRLNYALPGVFATNPYPHAVNGSLWTLPIEVSMYAALGLLAAAGLLRRAVVTVVVLVLGTLWFVLGPARLDSWAALFPDVLPPGITVHLGLWFFGGSLLWHWRLAYRGWVALALVACAWLTHGTSPGALLQHAAVAYSILWFAQADLGCTGRQILRGDFSYGMYLYAFPVQQTFAHFGAARWPLALYIGACLAVTLGCAMASWYAVEAPMLRRKRRAPAPSRDAAGRAGEHAPPAVT